jgi:hypothetical protein
MDIISELLIHRGVCGRPKGGSAEGSRRQARGHFAWKITSDPGKHDGLYREVKPGEAESPPGALAVEIAVEGYTRPTEKPLL